MKTTTLSRPAAQPPSAPRIESDTPIVPRAVMEAVYEEAGVLCVVFSLSPLLRRGEREYEGRCHGHRRFRKDWTHLCTSAASKRIGASSTNAK